MPDAIAKKDFFCPTCGSEMVQKNKARLLLVALCMLVSASIGFILRPFLAVGIVLGATGIYLLIWATLGKARWCRNCKKFSVQHR